MAEKILLLFTLKYPFGNSEGFIQNELPYLRKHFDRVVLLPSEKDSASFSELPEDVILDDRLTLETTPYRFGLVLPLFRSFMTYYLHSFWHSHEKLKYLRYIKGCLHHFYNDFRKFSLLKKIIPEYKQISSDIIAYDYWMLNSGLSLIECKKRRLLKTIVCRAHGFDLYKERHTGHFLPFVPTKLSFFDRIFTISEHGASYLKTGYSNSGKFDNIKTRYLGVEKIENGNSDFFKNLPDPRIVSCSALISVKNVDRLAKALNLVKNEFSWIHFGDGPEKEHVRKILDSGEKTTRCVLAGTTPNREVLEFYASGRVKVFISTSLSEGLPVSMMEAQSYGIPIIAPEVNGIPEIVNEKTGILFDPQLDAKNLASIIDGFLEKDAFSRPEIAEHYQKHFSAASNYDNFARELENLLSIKN